jgi:hypothetical protein
LIYRYKDIARSILKRAKEIEQRKRENEAAKLCPQTKKSGRKFNLQLFSVFIILLKKYIGFNFSSNAMRTMWQNGTGFSISDPFEDSQRHKVALVRSMWTSIFVESIS